MNAAPNDNPDSQSPPVGENGSSDAQPVAVTTETETSTRPDEFDVPERLPILPIRDTVAFPGTVMPLEVNREKSKRVLDMALGGSRLVAVVAQQSASIEDPKLEHLFRVGTVCRLLKLFQMPDGSKTVIVHGLVRVGIEKVTEDEGYLEATVHARPDSTETTKEIDALVHTVRHGADKVLERSENIPEEARIVLHGIETPGGLADFLAANLPLGLVHKQELLETFDVTDRLRKANLAVAAQLEILELSEKIQARVNEQVDKSQREYYLREQLKAIKKELGDRDSQDGTRQELLVRIKAAKMPEDVEKEALREVDRLEHIPQVSPEHGTVLDYLDWLVEIPWSKTTKDNLDINRAQEILDEDHYGLEKVKKRILEFLAVRTLSKKSRGPILCFIGPPGVGKTSLGKSIARALGRTFIRLSLGGVRDEAAIRGHRRTYIGAMPGAIVREIRKAGNRNPLF
ncbi:MAG: LON peptidase substrate-binding domain-containing protein, partial [Planctomycetes bacterium]|nr:LON peptidase substrate-binding domain-containing protein [Planctomycetota bacterium]